jgi:hypothetical protein
MAKEGYPPISPDLGFPGPGAPCPNTATLMLNAIPVLSALRGQVTSPPWNGTAGYQFCEEINYTAIFTNTQESVLTSPILEITLCKGLEFVGAKAFHNGGEVSIDEIIDAGPATERVVRIIIDPSVTSAPYGYPGDQLFVDFTLKPVCYFVNGYVPYLDFLAINNCTDWIGETKHTDPINIDGIYLLSDYLITHFAIQPLSFSAPTAALDLSNPTTAANSAVKLNASIQLNSALLTPNNADYIAIAIPPNMTIHSVTGQLFTFWKTEGNQNYYKTPIKNLNPGEIEELELMLTPVNPELWSCAPIDFRIFTGVFIPLVCEISCGIEADHNNEKIGTVQIIKNPLAGSYVSANQRANVL